jgi:hypothetical protein
MPKQQRIRDPLHDLIEFSVEMSQSVFATATNTDAPAASGDMNVYYKPVIA